MPRSTRDRQHLFRETLVNRIDAVQGHLDGIPVEGHAQHLQVDVWIFVAGEADKANLTRLARGEQRLHRPARRKPVRVGRTDHLVDLDQVDDVGPQSLEALVNLLRGNRGKCPSIFVMRNTRSR